MESDLERGELLGVFLPLSGRGDRGDPMTMLPLRSNLGEPGVPLPENEEEGERIPPPPLSEKDPIEWLGVLAPPPRSSTQSFSSAL